MFPSRVVVFGAGGESVDNSMCSVGDVSNMAINNQIILKVPCEELKSSISCGQRHFRK